MSLKGNVKKRRKRGYSLSFCNKRTEAMMMPRPIAKVNPLNACPPKMYIIRTTRNVVNDVSSVLDIVWLILFVIVCGVS